MGVRRKKEGEEGEVVERAVSLPPFLWNLF